jgi:serine/threonine-protein kinase
MVLPAEAAVALEGFPALALSPDGTCLAYVGRTGGITKLFLRKFTQIEPHAMPGTDGATTPFFSPDGKWIGFFACGKLKRVSATAGTPIDLCHAPDGRGAAWGAEGIVFAPSPAGALWKIDPAGGSLSQVTVLDPDRREVTHRWPEVLPDGKSVVFTVGLAGASDYEDARIAVLSPEGKGHRTLIQGGTQPRYLSSGHLVFAKSGALIGVPFDACRAEVSGYPIPVMQEVLTESTGASQWSASLAGTMAFISGGLRCAQRNLVLVSRNNTLFSARIDWVHQACSASRRMERRNLDCSSAEITIR